MQLTRDSVELLAPVGTWDVLESAINAGADAVYLGGKRFNMRLHRTDANFDDAALIRAIEYAHSRNVRLYITVNNLISDREIPALRDYLSFIEQIQPDALIIQDLSILELAREQQLTVPLHASVMLNTHNEQAIRSLQAAGITRVVTNREMTLQQLRYLRERTGIEIEYFIHGDMCIAHSGQCFHSGIVFGQSSNRGRCLKPCRWPYELTDSLSGKPLPGEDPGPYKLALKDMCMYRNLPELIQAGVISFKIEGRMRTADFVHTIVSAYRRAIDRYIADPTGYVTDDADWSDLFANRSRNFSTCYALGYPGMQSVDYTGTREPRFFSQAVTEAGLTAIAQTTTPPSNAAAPQTPELAVRVADLASAKAALDNGADVIYVGGEAFQPHHPWTIAEYAAGAELTAKAGKRMVITTPRITMERELGEYEQFFLQAHNLGANGLMVSNLGMLHLASQTTSLPLQTDYSFNTFNHLAVRWLTQYKVAKVTASLEATSDQLCTLHTNSSLPIEIIAHGPLEAMVMDHCLLASHEGTTPADCSQLCRGRSFCLKDTAGQQHPVVIDQYCRNHILFARDLCILPLLQQLGTGFGYRIEGQHYTSDFTGQVTAIYRSELDRLTVQGEQYTTSPALLDQLAAISPRPLGVGAFRYRLSR